MKNILIYILISIISVGSVVGVTTTVAKEADNIIIESSEVYEVVEFIAPKKTEYSISKDVYTVDLGKDENGNDTFRQQVDFDGTGMSITVKNTQTGETEKYDYTYDYFNLDGEKVKCENTLRLKFEPPINEELTQGEYVASVLLVTDDSHQILHDMKFMLIDDKEQIIETQSPTEVQPETEEPTEDTKQITEESDDSTLTDAPVDNSIEEPQEYDENSYCEYVLPDLRTVWHNENNPQGCSIVINYQDGNTLDFTVSSSRGNLAQIATSDITVTLNTDYDGVVVRGNADFTYVDSFGNSGTGSISVSENAIILVISEEYNDGRGWGISHTTGKYI
ncbi:MAG: hypothetical protein IKB73_05260 [Ruminococcus sp.]|nr:hypothetical protein [Ruminococcus sp.]